MSKTKKIIKTIVELIIAALPLICLFFNVYTYKYGSSCNNGYDFLAIFDENTNWAFLFLGEEAANFLFVGISVLIIILATVVSIVRKIIDVKKSVQINFLDEPDTPLEVITLCICLHYLITGLILIVDFNKDYVTTYTSTYWALVICVALIFVYHAVCNASFKSNTKKIPKAKEGQGPASEKQNNESDNITMVEKYYDLLQKGIITQEEFDQKKKQLLGFEPLQGQTQKESTDQSSETKASTHKNARQQFCTACGNKLLEGAGFCDICGKKVE